ncbi:MAG TPA: phage tail protein, partial [Cytophagales bacterium]|nr:phage tail protein [Cytophagales bacterium]
VSSGPVAVTGVSLSQSALSLNKGSSGTLVASGAPTDATDKSVSWSTSNAGVATVSNGLVSAIADGT